MDSFEPDGNGSQDALPPPPPIVPPNVVPMQAESEPVKKKVVRIPIARRGLGSKGQKIPLLTNHFKVNVTNAEGHFFHYSVCPAFLSPVFCYIISFPDMVHLIHTYFSCVLFLFKQVSVSYEDGRPVDAKGIGRKVIDRVHETYDTELAGKDFAYDGEKSLFTVGPLPRNKLEFTVVLEDVSSNR